MTNFIGYLCAALTTIAFIPQAIKVYKTKQTEDISFGMMSLMTTGVGLWVVYGFLLNAIPVIVANVLTFILSLYILIMKIRIDILTGREKNKL
jgi:MtN3 and saliva related transmembrane protein